MDDGDVIGLMDGNGQGVRRLIGGNPEIGNGDIVGCVDVIQRIFGDDNNKGSSQCLVCV
jgi:hypothetical protein